ncbi:hypothetical protein J4T77_03155 [Wolbachia endosymbiont of Drosophila innubila]|uniref:tetratricopeptide repeat protein n=1 Tax=Wolbachia endosymbiont of Drosophila innubila TaxID=282263 RepID=UPI001F193599|nr:hypothetical protein [Wolbachia endosymbiont of Drosophila innubila]UID81777.1 hypothetical protein J4T77_03155 [Wolbachia endosymbiont of Drosophila innubila]
MLVGNPVPAADSQQSERELIELLVTTPEEFEKKFNEILKTIPKVNSTSKSLFFLYSLIGGVAALPYTNLWGEVVSAAQWDFDFTNLTVDFCFSIIGSDAVSIRASVKMFDGEAKFEFERMGPNELECWYEVGHIDQQILLGEILKEQEEPGGREVQDVERVEKLFKCLKELYRKIDMNNPEYKTEAAQHGFACGVLMLCCKRYILDYYIEPTAGRGYADLILFLRKKDSEAISVIAEFKSRDISPDGARKQVEDKGYFYHPAILRSEKQNVIVACISFLHDTETVLVYEKEVSRPGSIVQILYEVYEAEKKGEEFTTSLEKSAESLYYSISNCESKNHYSFSRLILANHLLKDHIIKEDIRTLSMYASVCQSNGGVTLLLKMNRSNKAIMLNIVDVPRKETRNSGENYIFPNLTSHGVNFVLKVDIVVNRGDPSNCRKIRADISLNEGVDGKCSEHVITQILNTIDTGKLGQFIEGNTQSIEEICNKLQETVQSIDYDSRRIEQQNTITVITNEATFKALIQGLFITNKSNYLVSSESNILGDRIDLIIYDLEKKVVVAAFELKHHGSLKEAAKQLEGYLNNSEHEDITRICLNWDKRSKIESIVSLSKSFFSTGVKIAKENQEHVMKAIEILQIIINGEGATIHDTLSSQLKAVEGKDLESILSLISKSLKDRKELLQRDSSYLGEDSSMNFFLSQVYFNLGVEAKDPNERILLYGEAIKLYEEAKELRPEDPDVLLALGKAKNNLGIATNGSNERILLYEEAIKLYEEAKGLRPEDPDILLALGKAKRNLGIATNGSNEKILLYGEAIKLYEEAKELHLEDPDILLALGKAKHNLGNATNDSNEKILLYGEAIKLYEEAKELRPEDPDILLALGKGIATNGSNEKILPYEEAILYEELMVLILRKLMVLMREFFL